MKPNPWTLRHALDRIEAPPSAIVLVGDPVTDVQAAHHAGVRFIGYANKPGKAEQLHDAGADAIVTAMPDLADAVSAAGSVE
jgi:beta-phosphoglucomutase-like phosphatase (HAD superfamily)